MADLFGLGRSAPGISQRPIKGVTIGGATDTPKDFWVSKCTGSAGQRIDLGVVRRIRQQEQEHDVDFACERGKIGMSRRRPHEMADLAGRLAELPPRYREAVVLDPGDARARVALSAILRRR